MPTRLRLPLTPPQAVSDTTLLFWQGRQDRAAPGFVLAHGAGSAAGEPVLGAIAAGLAAGGHPVAALSFPFAEAGRRRPDALPRLAAAWRDALTWAHRHLGGRQLVIGGRSLGGRVASMLAADGQSCAGLALYAYPLHPALRAGEAPAASRLRTGHWECLHVPVLFCSGNRDPLCRLEVLERERSARLPHASVVILPGADHGWRATVASGRTRADAVADAVHATLVWARGLAEAPVA